MLAGCAALPSEGPSTGDLIESQGPIVVVEAEGDVTAALAARQSNGLGDVFEHSGTGASLRIAPGDVVNVTIYETVSEDLVSGLFAGSELPPQTVSRSGEIAVPFVGQVKVRGRTEKSVSAEIAQRLSEKTIDPSVLVTVQKRRSNNVSVVGDATEGGLVNLEPGAERLLDAVAQNGGVTVPVHEAIIALTRRDRTVRMAYHLILADPRHNVMLMPGDLVSVTREPKTFVAAGANGAGRVIPFREGDTTLTEALALAGGLLDQQADPAGVFVLRFEPRAFVETDLGRGPVAEASVPVAYRFNYREPEDIFLARAFMMRDDDILYVSNATSVQIQKFLDLFRTVIGSGSQAATFATP